MTCNGCRSHVEEALSKVKGVMAFGWGTDLTNDLVGCSPDGSRALDPISLVCKVTKANGRPAVKLSDNPKKATGDPAEVERYLKFFGTEDRVEQAVFV